MPVSIRIQSVISVVIIKTNAEQTQKNTTTIREHSLLEAHHVMLN